MAETRQIALGSLVKVDDDALGFDTQPLVYAATPPTRVREEIDGKVLADTLDVPVLGIEQVSKYEFWQYWHPGETEHEKMDTLFGSKAEKEYQLVTPHSTPVTDEFSGKVVALEPEQLDVSGLYKRKVTVLRTSAITRT